MGLLFGKTIYKLFNIILNKNIKIKWLSKIILLSLFILKYLNLKTYQL